MFVTKKHTDLSLSDMQAGSHADVVIHPLAEVEEGAKIGQGTVIWRFTHVRHCAVIGEHCTVGNGVYIDCHVRIGHRVKIQNGVLLYNGVTVDDEVFIGPNVTFTNDLYPRAVSPDWKVVTTHICHGASIGANATVVCGVRIGEYAMVGAGSVVTRDVPPLTLVQGNPARSVGFVCICGHKLDALARDADQCVCQQCRCAYRIVRNKTTTDVMLIPTPEEMARCA